MVHVRGTAGVSEIEAPVIARGVALPSFGSRAAQRALVLVRGDVVSAAQLLVDWAIGRDLAMPRDELRKRARRVVGQARRRMGLGRRR